jgi:hypothetical protein
MGSSAMSDYSLIYVEGYGFCLYIDDKANPLKLGGEGPRTPHQQLLLDAFKAQSDRIAALEARIKELDKPTPGE